MGINIKNLVMEYKKGVKSLDHINLNIEHGIYGLLGENGAGKSTLMKILVTLLTPTEGTVEINGIHLERKNYELIKKEIGYLPQELGLYPNLSVRESLEYVGIMSGLKKKEYEERIDYYLHMTGLTAQQRKKNKQLSGGMKRRVGLVQALLHNPGILIVDEPTTGLDPEERIRIRNLLVDFAIDRTVLFSTHVTEDLAATCDKLCILRKGKLTYDGSITELVSHAENHVFRCSFENERDFQEFQRKYRVTSKIYKANEIEVRFVNRKKPDFACALCVPNLEDAYIYNMYVRENA
ncbi:ATP-binding cassette domain-containing protein [Lachnospiraceae bacterium 46-15]